MREIDITKVKLDAGSLAYLFIGLLILVGIVALVGGGWKWIGSKFSGVAPTTTAAPQAWG